MGRGRYSETRESLSSTFGTARRDGAGSYAGGDVVLIGEHAYATRADTGTGLVAGGAPNYENVIGGNTANVDTATSNLTGAVALTDEDGNWVFILGGYDNVVNGWACIISGYHVAVAAGANHVTIAGGSKHVVDADTAYGTIGGGTLHHIAGTNATVTGGNNNDATGNGSTVSGGQNNTASGSAAIVAGGTDNTASAANATAVGGNTNTASGNSATVVGGLTNTASGVGATALGGRDGSAVADYSLVTGRGAVTADQGQHAHASTPFATAGDAQISRWSLKKQTTDATAGNLECITGAPPVIPVDTTWAFSALIVARRTDVDGDNAAFKVEGCLKRDAGNTAALVGTPTVTALGASAGAATWTVTTGAYSVGTLRLIVTGEAGKTIRWVASLSAASASG